MQIETLSPQGHALLALLGLMHHGTMVAKPFDIDVFNVASKAQSRLYVEALDYPEARAIYNLDDELQAIGDIAKAVAA